MKKIFRILFVLLISIPLIFTFIVAIDFHIHADIPHSTIPTRFKVYITMLTIIISVSAILLFILFSSFYKILDTTKEISEKLANGNLKDPIIKENKKNKKLTEKQLILQYFEKMRISLLEAQNQQERFIMGISHDTRTPIAVIKGYTEALSDGILSTPEEVQDALTHIAEKTNQLEEMANTLIDFTRKINIEEFKQENLKEVLTYFAQSCTLTLDIFDRKFSYSIDLPETLCTNLNKALVLRALDNLFSNAIRYTKEGDSIDFSAHCTQKEVLIAIKDSGPGISKEEQKNIFEIFFKGSNSKSEKGHGIGLAVVQNTMQIHSWTIKCESEEGQGACFTIAIPLESCSGI